MAIVVVAGIMLIGAVAARVRSPDQRTGTTPAPRPPVPVQLPPHEPSGSPSPQLPEPAAVPSPVVQPGDSLWAIAAAHVSDKLGRSPSDDDIAPYWFDLVRANARNLVHPGDADLVYPGQVVELPTE